MSYQSAALAYTPKRTSFAPTPPPGVIRIAALASLNREEAATLLAATGNARKVSARREIMHEGEAIPQASVLLTGWACRVQSMPDGRRQIVSIFLPGDLLGACRHANPVAPTTLIALTDVTICLAPAACADSTLAEAYAVGTALGECYLLRQVTRLGRMSAYERMADWLLEMRDRLMAAGLTNGVNFAMPLTQEMLADVLGLTSVHVNRTLQAMRRDGVMTLRGGTVTLCDPVRLARMVDHRPATVSASLAVKR